MSANMQGLVVNKDLFIDQLKKFIIDNGVIGTTAGVCIALVTKDLISSLVGDIIIPSFILLLLGLNIKSITNILPGKSSWDFQNFLKQFISWIMVIIVTFIFIKVSFGMLLGTDKVEKKPETKTKEAFYSY
jgi:large-conductance mechanosensitive channel